ncbi:hypothetical protein AB431_05625 [Mycobacterium sp. EPa45]|nr:hypothetical protein AB431_05625 [Mycobacterium sp. EPa45]
MPEIFRQSVADGIEAIYRLSEAIPFLGSAISIVDVAWYMGEVANAVTAHDKDRLSAARYDLIWSCIGIIPGVGTVEGLFDQTADFLNFGFMNKGKELTIHRAIDGVSFTHFPLLAYSVILAVDAHILGQEAIAGWRPD